MKYTIYLLLLLLLTLTSCNAVETLTGIEMPESTSYEIEEVVRSGGYQERTEIQKYPINNCKCQTETVLTVTRQRTLEESVEKVGTIEATAGLTAVSFAEFSLAVGKEYGVGQSTSITDSGSLEVKADPRTYPVYTIAWNEIWETGYVVVNHKGKEVNVEYLFLKTARPELINVDYYDCEEAGTGEVPGTEYKGTHYEQGEAAYFNGDFETVITEMSLVVEAVPDKVPAYIYRGLAYYNQGLYIEAIADYTKAIELEPDNTIAYYDRGLACYKQGLYDQAIADYTKALQLGYNYADCYVGRGNVYRLNKQYNLAIVDYNKAIELDPEYALAYYTRGLAYYNQSLYGRAIADYNKAIELNPEYADYYYNRATAYKMLGNKAAAIADFEKYISLSASPEWIEKARQEIAELKR